MWCFSILTACHLVILHVKLYAINIFNRLSLLANQLPSQVNQTQYSNCNKSKIIDRVKTDETQLEKTADAMKSILPTRKFIMSSSLQLHEDDLSRIDVKSLVSGFCVFYSIEILLSVCLLHLSLI